jgi:hypothetical protein
VLEDDDCVTSDDEKESQNSQFLLRILEGFNATAAQPYPW